VTYTTELRRDRAGFRAVCAAAVFVYLALLRTRQITECFGLLGDQILYWRMAMGPWHDLPAGGGPTSAGGTTLGPVFCWFIWVAGRTLGPLTGYLPHAGGIAVSLVQSLADALLFLAIWKRLRAPVLALAVVLLAATSPFDMSLSATIWNPPFAVALAKFSLAAVLWAGADSGLLRQALAIVPAWLAVQAHSPAIFFAIPVLASFTASELAARHWKAAAARAGTAALIVLVLQVPYLADRLRHPASSASPQLVVQNVSQTLARPSMLRPIAAVRGVTGSLDFILFRPRSVGWPAIVFLGCATVVLVRYRKDLVLLASTVAPIACAAAGFALWQKGYDTYWFLVIAPSAALVVGLAMTAWPRLARTAAFVLLALVALAQPSRSSESLTLHRLPEYGRLVRGSREIRQHLSEIRALRVTFPLPGSTEPAYLYELMGGRVSASAPYVATIDASGRASFALADREAAPGAEE
jgi:hypothetical protein